MSDYIPEPFDSQKTLATNGDHPRTPNGARILVFSTPEGELSSPEDEIPITSDNEEEVETLGVPLVHPPGLPVPQHLQMQPPPNQMQLGQATLPLPMPAAHPLPVPLPTPAPAIPYTPLLPPATTQPNPPTPRVVLADVTINTMKSRADREPDASGVLLLRSMRESEAELNGEKERTRDGVRVPYGHLGDDSISAASSLPPSSITASSTSTSPVQSSLSPVPSDSSPICFDFETPNTVKASNGDTHASHSMQDCQEDDERDPAMNPPMQQVRASAAGRSGTADSTELYWQHVETPRLPQDTLSPLLTSLDAESTQNLYRAIVVGFAKPGGYSASPTPAANDGFDSGLKKRTRPTKDPLRRL
ncbi:hypothetical protein C8T65DRAFT_734716 [Cerioporus squamosus]|nr:hypothetical protein C8T65DRAFT_734716 [Cerioporus squamosus]